MIQPKISSTGKAQSLTSYLLFSFIIILLSGCTPEGLMRTWSTNEEYNRSFQNIMAMGLVNNVNLRNDLENEVVYAAQKAGIKSKNAMSMFPPELGKPFEDIERVKTRLKDKGFDGILTIALINVSAERYIGPDVAYEPLVYYDRFRTYYFRTYELVYRPGYFSQYAKYFIETNFYELGAGKLVWSGRSRVFEPDELESFSTVYARQLFQELTHEGVIAK
jgi:hypothetical protein